MRWLAAVLPLLCACPATPGLTCTKHEDCKSLPNGYCARAQICTRECDERSPCVDGSACVDAGRRQVCLPTCTDDAGCPARFGCRPMGEPTVCQLDRAFEPAK